MPRRLSQCSNVDDLRDLARRRLPGPIFHYIDGAADDEVTYRRNTEAYEANRNRFQNLSFESFCHCPFNAE